MKWLIKHASVQMDNTVKFEPKYPVGTQLKHKASGLPATILNYYQNWYMVSMERSGKNNFKKQIIALKEERITSEFTPAGKAEKDATRTYNI